MSTPLQSLFKIAQNGMTGETVYSVTSYRAAGGMRLFIKAVDDPDTRVEKLVDDEGGKRSPTYGQLRVHNIAIKKMGDRRCLSEIDAWVDDTYINATGSTWLRRCMWSLLTVDGSPYDDWYGEKDGPITLWKSPSTLGMAVHVRRSDPSSPEFGTKTITFEVSHRTSDFAEYQMIIDDTPVDSETAFSNMQLDDKADGPAWCFVDTNNYMCRLFWKRHAMVPESLVVGGS